MSAYSLLLLVEARLARSQDFLPLKTIDTFGSKQGQAAYLPSLFSIDSQLSTKIKNNLQSNFFRGFYLVTKGIKKKISAKLVACGRLAVNC